MRPFAFGAIPCRSLPDPRLSFTKVLRVQHPSISSRPFKFQQNARFSVLTDNESIFLTNNKLFNASTLADCVYFINPHLFKLQKNAHRNIKRLKVIIKDKAVNTTTSNSIVSVSVVV